MTEQRCSPTAPKASGFGCRYSAAPHQTSPREGTRQTYHNVMGFDMHQNPTLVKPCLTVNDADALQWNESVDVLVAGFGAAGAAAALQAHESGARVLIVDRFEGGGASAFSGGVIYAGNTRYQHEAGIDDPVEELLKYLKVEMGTVVPERILRRYAETSSENLEWLAGHGVPFCGIVYEEKTVLPPDGTYLYYAGNEKVAAYKALAKPAPRGHKVVGSGMTGHILFATLKAAVTQAGIGLWAHSPVSRLVVDAQHRVIGAEVHTLPPSLHEAHQRLYRKVAPMVPFDGPRTERAIRECRQLELQVKFEPRLIRARRGVVLATGGFQHNLAMVSAYRPTVAANYRSLMRLGSMGNDGSGVELGQSLGGGVALMDSLYLGRTLAPPNALLKGILVDSRGQRFINEDAYTGFVGNAIATQPEGIAWLVLPASSLHAAIKECLFSGSVVFRYYGLPTMLNIVMGKTKRAKNIDQLAIKCGIDAGGLRRTIADYNRLTEHKAADPLEKSSAYLQSLGNGPYYALNASISNRFAFTHMLTLGGLTVDPDTGNVTRADGSIIEGLYAAGRVAVGLCSKSYVSGMSLGDCIFAGRRAARSAMSDG
jgi:3-oxo-5alpha-steroid 4-dehydrogenase